MTIVIQVFVRKGDSYGSLLTSRSSCEPRHATGTLSRTNAPEHKHSLLSLAAPMNFMSGFDEPDGSLIRSHMRDEDLESHRTAQPLSLCRPLCTTRDVACVVGIPVF